MNPIFQVLKHRNYRLYFLGQIISMSGTWMQSTVQAWLVYRLSHSAAWLGIMSFCNQIAAFVFSPIAGLAADRWDRRKLLIIFEAGAMIQAFALGVLILRGDPPLEAMAALAVFLGIVSAFEVTTRHTLVANLVEPSAISGAVALNSILLNSTRILGPAIAGLLIGPLGEAGCVFLNAISFAAVIYGLVQIQLPHSHPSQLKPSLGRPSPWTQWKSALIYVHRRPDIRSLLALAVGISFVGFPYQVLLPVFAREILGGDAQTLGWLMGASGAGAVIGAFAWNAALDPEDPRSVRHKLRICLFGMAVGLCTLSLSQTLAVSLAATFMIGLFMMGAFPMINTTIQSQVDDELRGRVMSLYTMTFSGAVPVGSLIAGHLADLFGAERIAALCALILSIMGLLWRVEAPRSFGPRPPQESQKEPYIPPL